MTEIVLWLAFGALAGWIAALLTGTHSVKGQGRMIAVGILGAILGGCLVRLNNPGTMGLSASSLLIATISAILLISTYKALARR